MSRHADISFVLSDKRFGRDFVGAMTRRFGSQVLDEPVYRSMSQWMLQQNPPTHTRLRGLVAKAFNARRLERMRERIREIVDQAIDRVASRGHMDLIADFAFRLPSIVICEMLGVPDHDRETVFAASRTVGRMLDSITVPFTRAEIDEANASNATLTDYFHRLFELRRQIPTNDLITELIHAEDEGSKLSNEELTANIILLFAAGHETTVSLIGNGLLAFYNHPDQLRLLRERPSLAPSAVVELLRYDCPVQITGRAVQEDVEVSGTKLARGESILCLLGAANRDPAIYANPDQLDITRPNTRPLSFGGGIHYCLGAQLARLEGEIAISTLLHRLPNLAIHDLDNPNWPP
jgi:cytochrome P450